jgi:hypothetical protein
MNIWARRRGSQNDNADQAPTLFFIQCRNSDQDMQDMAFLCCPISDLSKHAGMLRHKVISVYLFSSHDYVRSRVIILNDIYSPVVFWIFFVYSVVDYTANENKFILQTTQQWPFMSIHVKGL